MVLIGFNIGVDGYNMLRRKAIYVFYQEFKKTQNARQHTNCGILKESVLNGICCQVLEPASCALTHLLPSLFLYTLHPCDKTCLMKYHSVVQFSTVKNCQKTIQNSKISHV